MTGVVVDTSAVMAILRGEAGASDLEGVMSGASTRYICAATVVELALVVESRHPTLTVERVVREFQLTSVAVDDDLAQRAIEAWRRFGRGRHPARLNYGDCFSYALAERLGLPLVCVGDDFAQTDAELAWVPG